jgi:S-DNA-T family DNA segregation ATPase FtsK/SpoIIIE
MGQNIPRTEKPNLASPEEKEKVKPKKSPAKPIVNLAFTKHPHFWIYVRLFTVFFSAYLFIALLSFPFTGEEDNSLIDGFFTTDIRESGREAVNWTGLIGAFLAHYLIYRGIGIAAFVIPIYLFIRSAQKLLKLEIINTQKFGIALTFWGVWLSCLGGYLLLTFKVDGILTAFSGSIGYEIATIINELIGFGSVLFYGITLVGYIVLFSNKVNWIPDLSEPKLPVNQKVKADAPVVSAPISEEEELPTHSHSLVDELLETEVLFDESDEPIIDGVSLSITRAVVDPEIEIGLVSIPDSDFVVLPPVQEKVATEGINYDPKLDLSRYQSPSIELLRAHGDSEFKVPEEEVKANKDRIVDTLSHYGITITHITAVVGPTVTLYEIIPDKGIRISKIKNLEDDIALSLQALGIRIIAPIPGKGTIGIEVANKNRSLVSLRSVLATEKFMNSTFELPVVLGRTISNEVFIADLAKMPHLLMAGATGQGKSVGLNVLLTSLLYKKHPSQLKVVLVDPKKVELSIYATIERHFLAKLPNTEDAIITDTKKVIHTLNSLCEEMDMRYSMLKEAGCRNLKEYNLKFVERKLLPSDGHRFLPYIVLIIDELADLMMTAGKEVETPIARLAQLARAIGIHLVVATQRPSVNVITGLIKANFPARLSFKTTSKIDSRTILDQTGAEHLVGQGDMLFSSNSELTRLQCPFVDTPEVEAICEWIGNQQGYSEAYQLPEFVDPNDDSSDTKEFALNELDKMFAEAARVVVRYQQGSTSLIQRKLKLGFARAGRIMDQLEAYSIVGPPEGSKVREVYINDEMALEQRLSEMGIG